MGAHEDLHLYAAGTGFAASMSARGRRISKGMTYLPQCSWPLVASSVNLGHEELLGGEPMQQ